MDFFLLKQDIKSVLKSLHLNTVRINLSNLFELFKKLFNLHTSMNEYNTYKFTIFIFKDIFINVLLIDPKITAQFDQAIVNAIDDNLSIKERLSKLKLISIDIKNILKQSNKKYSINKFVEMFIYFIDTLKQTNIIFFGHTNFIAFYKQCELKCR